MANYPISAFIHLFTPRSHHALKRTRQQRTDHEIVAFGGNFCVGVNTVTSPVCETQVNTQFTSKVKVKRLCCVSNTVRMGIFLSLILSVEEMEAQCRYKVMCNTWALLWRRLLPSIQDCSQFCITFVNARNRHTLPPMHL